MGCGCIPYLVDSFHCGIYRCVKSNSILCTCNVKINGSRKGNGINPQGRQFLGAFKRAVPADDNHAVNAVLFTDFRTFLLAFLCDKLHTAGCLQNRTSPLDGIGDASCLHINNLFLEKSRISSLNSFYF